MRLFIHTLFFLFVKRLRFQRIWGGRSVGVFVALCDNEHQGIAPVPAKIGNGDDPERNLYWGCTEGLKGVFDQSATWTLVEKVEKPEDEYVLRRRIYRHKMGKLTLDAHAYRGSSIKNCIQDFEIALQLGAYDLVVFLGHNGLMDFDLPELKSVARIGKKPDCIVLCCKSEPYFKTRILSLEGRPILLTTQLMYPGAFILHDVIKVWRKGDDLKAIRKCAGSAYARNQNLSNKTGRGVFADLEPFNKNKPMGHANVKP
jgi:hypothetical protein